MMLTQYSKQDGLILIIDHEPDQLAETAGWLRREGYRVHTKRDGLAGLAYWREHAPAVLICDVAVPGCDGLAILREVAATENETQVIILSRTDETEAVLAALRLGAADYLRKPLRDEAMFLHAVNRAFEEHRLIRENRLYREALEAKNRELNESLRLLKEDQEAGKAVQRKILPEPNMVYGDVHIAYTIVPSLYLSGDFIDYFELDSGQIGFYLADVSGHGASSAFVTVLLKNMANRLKQRFREDPSKIKYLMPADVLRRANEELIPLGLGKHLAIFCGLIDIKAKRLVYCSAAHLPPPILVTNGKTQALEGSGLPVGLFEDIVYENQEVEIGDSFDLVLFSDGILEIMPEETVAEKERRLMALVSKGIHNIAQLCDHLALHQYEAVPDDIAIMTVSRRAV